MPRWRSASPRDASALARLRRQSQAPMVQTTAPCAQTQGAAPPPDNSTPPPAPTYVRMHACMFMPLAAHAQTALWTGPSLASCLRRTSRRPAAHRWESQAAALPGGSWRLPQGWRDGEGAALLHTPRGAVLCNGPCKPARPRMRGTPWLAAAAMPRPLRRAASQPTPGHTPSPPWSVECSAPPCGSTPNQSAAVNPCHAARERPRAPCRPAHLCPPRRPPHPPLTSPPRTPSPSHPHPHPISPTPTPTRALSLTRPRCSRWPTARP